jgi:hypothetical protein
MAMKNIANTNFSLLSRVQFGLNMLRHGGGVSDEENRAE